MLSLYRSNLFLGTQRFIGLENFKNIFTGVLAPGFRQVLLQTLLFSGVVVVFGLAVQPGAGHPSQPARARRARVPAAAHLAFALSPAVAGTIFLFMFSEVGW